MICESLNKAFQRYSKHLTGLVKKRELQENEAAWRHDHDRLLFDFFIHHVKRRKDDGVPTLMGGQPILHLEDPLSRPT